MDGQHVDHEDIVALLRSCEGPDGKDQRCAARTHGKQPDLPSQSRDRGPLARRWADERRRRSGRRRQVRPGARRARPVRRRWRRDAGTGRCQSGADDWRVSPVDVRCDARRGWSSNVKKPATVRFTEEMHGAVGFGAATYREGWDEGIASTCPFMFHLTISVDDLDRFADDPHHTAPAVGWVRCPPLSAANMLVERGEVT